MPRITSRRGPPNPGDPPALPPLLRLLGAQGLCTPPPCIPALLMTPGSRSEPKQPLQAGLPAQRAAVPPAASVDSRGAITKLAVSVRPCAGPPLAAPQLGSDSLRVTCDGSVPQSPSPPAPADGSPAPPAGVLQAAASARVGHSPCPTLPALSRARSRSYRPPASRNLAPQSVHTNLRPLSTRSPRF